MHKPTPNSVWQGRIDPGSNTQRWHQVITPWDGQSDLNNAVTLLGFACDEGVRRNQGRPGAAKGPWALRTALANLSYPHADTPRDAGDVICEGENLEQAQLTLAEQVTKILSHNGAPIVLGGGHEMAWGSFLGLAGFLNATKPSRRIGIINFDAHFDLRDPQPQPNSGTPFRQIAAWCGERQQPFHYLVLGLNPSANTGALFDFARQTGVEWHTDIECNPAGLQALEHPLSQFLGKIDELYLTICLDVFPVPGVSAPTAVGIAPATAIQLITTLKRLCKQHKVNWRLSDIAELNPDYDRDDCTAKLAARLVYELANRP